MWLEIDTDHGCYRNLYYYHILILLHIYIKTGLLQKMNTATTIAIVAIMAALAFVAGNFAIMKAFAQQNPTPSPNSQAYLHACVYQEPGGTEAAFCLPP